MRRDIVVLSLAVSLLWCGSGMAQKKAEDEAKKQFEVGVQLFEKGQYEKASVAFARAYELRPSYKITYLVAKCEDELGHYAASLEAFTRYIEEGGDQIDKARREDVNKEIERLQSMVGMVEIDAGESGLTVFVDGRRLGETPLAAPLFVDLGEHEVQLKRGVAEVHREVIRVAGGQRVAVRVEDAPGEPTEVARDADEPPPEGQGGAEKKVKRLWTWVAFGVGGAAAVGAAVTGGLSLSKANDVKDQCSGDSCAPSLEGEADTARTLGYTADALIAVAGVGIAAGVVLYFMEPKWFGGESAVEVAPVAAPAADGAAFAIVGRF